MHETIENTIKKNLPEKKEITCDLPDIIKMCKKCEDDTIFNQALSQINTSLIADEVLKVVVEKIKEELENIPKVCCLEKIIEGACSCNNEGLPFYEVECIEQLLSNLSPNKENKNNEKV